jgi:hypothetical protein
MSARERFNKGYSEGQEAALLLHQGEVTALVVVALMVVYSYLFFKLLLFPVVGVAGILFFDLYWKLIKDYKKKKNGV